MGTNWAGEVGRLILVLGIGFLVGVFSGQVLLCMLAASLLYSLRSIYNLHRLARWLCCSMDPEQVPIHFGIWGGIYARIWRFCKQARDREQLLQRELDQFRASAAALPDATLVLGPGGEIRWHNHAATELFGLRHEQDAGQRLINLFRSPDLAAYLDQRDFDKSLVIRAPGTGMRRLSIRVSEYGDGQMLLLAQDVTERFLSEQIRKDFVANVSHELRTPLTVISGFVENMQFATAEQVPAQWEKPLQLIADQTERMQHIVEDLLLLARLEGASQDTKRETVDVASLLHTIVGEAEALAGERQIRLQVESTTNLAGDQAQLRSAFSNLVVNAIHHTPARTNITLVWREHDEGACFEVLDDGDGIPQNHLPRLAERFYRVDSGRSRERGGTGLGLAIVKHILQHHGARLQIESEVGHGSSFSCIFPCGRLIKSEQALTTQA